MRAQQLVAFALAVGGGFLVLCFLEAALQFGQLPVLQLGYLVEVAFAGVFLNLKLDFVQFFAHLLAALGRRFFTFPDFFQIGILPFEFANFAFEVFEAFLRGLVLFLLEGFALDLELDQAAVELVHRLGLGIDFQFDLGRGLVNQVDGLIRQKAVGDVAVAQLRGSHDGWVGDFHAVVNFVFFLQAAQDGNGGFDAGFIHHHFLEAALQRGILLDVFAVFIQCGSTDAVQLPARQGGLEHVAGIHGAFGFAGTDHGMDFVDEQNGLAFVLGELLEYVFQAFLKIAAVFGTGQKCGHIECQHAFALERIRHFARHNALCQSFHDGGLAHAGLADQYRVVLAAALQHLDGAANFVVASDHRVEFALAGAFGQVQRVFLECLALFLGVGTVHVLATAHGVNGGFQAFASEAIFTGNIAHRAFGIGTGQKIQFAGNELVAALDGLFFGGLQQLDQIRSWLHLFLSLHVRQTVDGAFGRSQKARDVYTGALQQRTRTVLLLKHGG